jgi:hypothetical protein
VVVRVASTAAVAAAAGPPVGFVVGASVVAAATVRVMTAAAGRSTVRDDLAVAVATLWGSAGVRASTVGLCRELSSSTVATEVSTVTCSFVVAVPGGRRLVDPVVDPHEVGVFSELGDDFSSAYTLSLACDRCDRHKALLRGSVYPTLDCFESFRKVVDGEVVSEPPASFVAPPVTLTSSVPVGGGLVCRCVGRQLVCRDVFKVFVCSRPRWSGGVAGSHEYLAIRDAKTRLGARHLSWGVRVSPGKWSSLLEWERVDVGDVA